MVTIGNPPPPPPVYSSLFCCICLCCHIWRHLIVLAITQEILIGLLSCLICSLIWVRRYLGSKMGQSIEAYFQSCFYLPRRRRPGTGDIATPPICLSVRPSVCPSVCLSVTFSFRTVTQKRIDVFSRNVAGMCTMSWGCAV